MSVSVTQEVVLTVHLGSRFVGKFNREELLELHVATGQILNGDHWLDSAERIIEIVCRHCEISRGELMGNARPDRIAFPRHIAMTLVRNRCHWSLNEVGAFFGGRDHGTVMNAARRVEERRSIGQKDATIIRAIEAAIEAQCQKPVAAPADVGPSVDAAGTSLADPVGTRASVAAAP